MNGKLLLMYFEPFNGRSENTSERAVKCVPDKAGDLEITKLCLPVVYGEAARIARDKAKQINASAVLCIGEAGSRKNITVERRAENKRNSDIPDNNGKIYKNQRIIKGAEEFLPSTFPAAEAVDAVKKLGIDCALSDSAGTYVCNDLFFNLLYYFRDSDVKCGFIHVPAENVFSDEELCTAISSAINCIKQNT